MRNKVYLFFSLLIILFSIPCYAATATKQPLTLILDWFINPNHAPIFVAEQQGFFNQEGISITIINPANPGDAVKLVAAGKAELGLTYQPQMLIQVGEGLPLAQIATLIDKPLNCLAVNASSSIRSITDLKGKTIGYSSDAVDKAILAIMLKSHGLSLSDVSLINVRYGLTQALLANKVDAITGIMRNFELIEMQLAGKPARAFYVEQNGMPSYDELILVTNRKTIGDPRLVKFVAALKLGADYLQAHPEQSWQLFAKTHPELNNELNHRAWFATLPYFAKNPAAYDKAHYQELLVLLQKQGLIRKTPIT